jgi:hypothetical protein
MTSDEWLEAGGFLSKTTQDSRGNLRAECPEWFTLVVDISAALTRAVQYGMNNVQTISMDPKAVGVRVGQRALGAFQGIILLTERGMVSEARTLVRVVLECAFGISALISKPEEFMKALDDDYRESRRRRGEFLSNSNTITPEDIARLQPVLEMLEKRRLLSPKALVNMGVLQSAYLPYLWFSDDAVHLSARSLDRYVEQTDGDGWYYRVGPGTSDENRFTLSQAVFAAVPTGIGLTEFIGDSAGQLAFTHLAERFRQMPSVAIA